jgi:deoxyribose-phosphate aldolase
MEQQRIEKKLNEISSLKSQLQRNETLRIILGLLDLTTLEGNDTNEKVIKLCHKALSLKGIVVEVTSTAAVCVYPMFVSLAKQILSRTTVKVASVAGGFPSGQMPLHLRVAEVQYAVEQGADEIDMVISRGRFLQGEFDFIEKEVRLHKQACGTAHLKVILETGELIAPEHIKKASELAILGGADFIKTSTGKIQPAATLEAALIMLEVIAEHYRTTGTKIGFKPAGGIATSEEALEYYLLVQQIVGQEWITPDLFRYGASRLFDNIIHDLNDLD